MLGFGMDGAKKAGIVSLSSLEPSLAVYLAPACNNEVSYATLQVVQVFVSTAGEDLSDPGYLCPRPHFCHYATDLPGVVFGGPWPAGHHK